MTAPGGTPRPGNRTLATATAALSVALAAALASGVLRAPQSPPPVGVGPIMVQVSGQDSIRVEAVPLPKANPIFGDVRITLVKSPPDSAWPYGYVESERDSALAWAHMVDSVAAQARPDSTPGHVSGIDTLVHVFPPGGPLWHNSDVLEYDRDDLHAGRGMQNYISIGTGPPLASGSMPGIYYGPVYPAVEVTPANIAALTAAIRRVLGVAP